MKEKTNNKKPIIKRWWFWAIIVIVAIGAIGAGGEDSSTDIITPPAETASADPEDANTPVETAGPAETTESNNDQVPAEYKSALKKATAYANSMNMSKIGVFNQLTSEYGEQFSEEAAQYAIDNVKADWKANALAKAKSYQETMAMSPASVRDQLVSEYGEKFTAEEADYAIQHLND